MSFFAIDLLVDVVRNMMEDVEGLEWIEKVVRYSEIAFYVICWSLLMILPVFFVVGGIGLLLCKLKDKKDDAQSQTNYGENKDNPNLPDKVSLDEEDTSMELFSLNEEDKGPSINAQMLGF